LHLNPEPAEKTGKVQYPRGVWSTYALKAAPMLEFPILETA
jgi:hypothetical protein